MRSSKPKLLIVIVVLVVAGLLLVWRSSRQAGEVANAAPTRIESADAPGRAQELTMADVLELARDARKQMSDSLDDYTARFVKQERDTNGVLGEETQLFVKVQTRLRGDGEESPMRVYLRFDAPQAVKGREVIWAEDLHEGQMAVHEVGLLLSLKTIWLDPNGMIAMRGQRYPISEIGLVKLVEKLIERGEQDRDNPDIKVTLDANHKLDDVATQLIQVRRSKPSNGEDDFSLAEIVIDLKRHLVLSFRSFGWPEQEGAEPPLLESYTYHDVQTNVGLSEADFDPTNTEYSFPTF